MIEPFHSSLAFYPPRFHYPVSKSIQEKYLVPFFSAFSLKEVQGVFTCRSYNEGELANLYSLRCADGDFILKLRPEISPQRTQLLDDLLVYLSETNAPIPKQLKDFTGHCLTTHSNLPGFHAECSHFITGEYYGIKMQALSRIGASMRKIHHVLAAWPARNICKKLSDVRQDQLLSVVNALETGRYRGRDSKIDYWLKENVDYIKRLIAFFPNIQLPAPFQVIHGDCNRGNIILGNDGIAYVFDFEDATFTHVSPLIDVAILIERFVLHELRDNTDLEPRLKTLITAYAPRDLDISRLHDALLLLPYRNTLRILKRIARPGFPTPLAELNKFTQLEKRTRSIMPRLNTALRALQ